MRVRRSCVDDAWVAEFAEIVSIGLRAGLDLRAATLVAARTPGVAAAAPWLEDAVRAAALTGSSVAGCLVPPHADAAPGALRDLAVLERAWRLCESTGAAASHTSAAAASAVRARTAARQRADAALAGPRASMRMLTALPLAGPVVGVLVGIEPTSLYGSLPARGSAVAGLALTAAGWWWATVLVDRAARPSRTSGSA